MIRKLMDGMDPGRAGDLTAALLAAIKRCAAVTLCSGWLRPMLLEYLGESPSCPQRELEEMATSECWAALLEDNGPKSGEVEGILGDLADEEMSPMQAALALSELAAGVVRTRIRDLARNRDYAQLRQNLKRSHAPDGTPNFCSVRGPRGQVYAPAGQAPEGVIATCGDEKVAPAGLGAVDPAAYSQRQGEWNGEVLARELVRFWRAFVDAHHGGQPAFVPLYAAYCWMAATLGLNTVRAMRPIAGTEEAKAMAPGSVVTPEEISECLGLCGGDPTADAVSGEEMGQLAQEAAAALPDAEATVCALLFDPDDDADPPTLQEIADRLGLSGAPAAHRLKGRMLLALKSFISQRLDVFRHDERNLRSFAGAVARACKKRLLAPTGGNEGGD